jgi:hypothetical protein
VDEKGKKFEEENLLKGILIATKEKKFSKFSTYF